MNTTESIPSEHATSTLQTSNSPSSVLPAQPRRLGRLLRLVLGLFGAFAIMLYSSLSFGADAASAKVATNAVTEAKGELSASDEKAKAAVVGDASPHAESFLSKAMKKAPITGGVDPHGNSLESIQNSLQQFGHLEFVLRLFLSLLLSVACSWIIAYHPRSMRVDPLTDLEERKAFIILGVVGAIVAELSGTNQTLAFVIFGIGALLRFRTVLDNPKATGKAILVVVIGLACGMGSWTMAVFVTAFCWFLLYWLDSKVYCWIKIRLDGDADPKPVSNTVQSLLVSHHCRIQSQTLAKGKRRVVFLFQMPAGLHPNQLEAELKVKLPKIDESRINVEVV